MSRDDPPASATRLRSAALVGNPNAGKSALFNALTGARQKIAVDVAARGHGSHSQCVDADEGSAQCSPIRR